MSKITDIVEDLRNIENLTGSAQEVLVSGENIKTINGQSVLGSGNIEITSGTGTGIGNCLSIEDKTKFMCTIVISSTVSTGSNNLYCIV